VADRNAGTLLAELIRRCRERSWEISIDGNHFIIESCRVSRHLFEDDFAIAWALVSMTIKNSSSRPAQHPFASGIGPASHPSTLCR
jgi:hypothetical protein